MEYYKIINSEIVKKYQESRIEISELKKQIHLLNEDLLIINKENFTLKNIIKMYIQSGDSIKETVNSLRLLGEENVSKSSPRKSRATLSQIKQPILNTSSIRNSSNSDKIISKIQRVKGQSGRFSFSPPRSSLDSESLHLNLFDHKPNQNLGNSIETSDEVQTEHNVSEINDELSVIEEDDELFDKTCPYITVKRKSYSKQRNSSSEYESSIETSFKESIQNAESFINNNTKVTVNRKGYSKSAEYTINKNSPSGSSSETLMQMENTNLNNSEKESNLFVTVKNSSQYYFETKLSEKCSSTPYNKKQNDISVPKISDCFVLLTPINVNLINSKMENDEISIQSKSKSVSEQSTVSEIRTRPKRAAAPSNFVVPKINAKMRR